MFSSNGWVTEVHHPSELGTGSMHKIPQAITDGSYELLWIAMPNLKSVSRTRRDQALRNISVYMRKAKQHGVQAVLIGLAGKLWKHEDLNSLQLQRQAIRTQHNMCHYGIKLLEGSIDPSDVQYHTLTTFPVSSSPCQCSPDIAHACEYDLLPTLGRGELKATASLKVYLALATRWSLLEKDEIVSHIPEPRPRSGPDYVKSLSFNSTIENEPPPSATCQYPTEAKEREKKRRKHRKNKDINTW